MGMGIIFQIIGWLLAIVGFLLGFSSVAASAFQQQVQADYFVIGVLGLVAAAIGSLLYMGGDVREDIRELRSAARNVITSSPNSGTSAEA